MSDDTRARLVGINHVALSVGDADEAESFSTDLFAFEIRGRTDSAVFLDMGDQFLALSETDDAGETADGHRHLGLVVEYREIQFTKADHVLAGMGLSLDKSDSAVEELAETGMAPEEP
jgi:catechol 2,3-dioxygenase-like lactoylglutathione lyase family enzyme